jgi:DNA repair exonuclease SbcCD nuclease subunit
MVVTFQIISDTHLECSVKGLKDMLDVTADVLCLLGDIGSPFQSTYVDFLKECSLAYKHVLVISGNHEYYNTEGYHISFIDEGIAGLCAQFANVHYLNNKNMVIDDVNFIGSTLWSHLPEDKKHEVAAMYNDYNYIYCEERVRLHPDYTNKMFAENIAFIEKAISEGLAKGLKNVVLTHHTPSFKHTDPKHEDSLFRFGLSTELTHAFDGRFIKYWACGHTHVNFDDVDINGTKMICNQFGRKTTSITRFNKNKYYVL